ncbi:TadE/TadG family type IV pilus assembly protein [Eubacterium coprostanoligenes]|uniref:Flp pilus assembly protein TadG n=1 Tax=Eubacterium coprostanoligenes TaxID=290054 RepID=A0A1T4MBH0_9FIRM|nr:TadE/TadG family type IV pilus assembly protein [Eubacterium coprostanoligenes]SJZ64187.1 Flp pilus assembly protein TadG [Eubacterium coprostanoligenes]
MKKLFRRKENGDIALISVFASILILTIFALIVDFGLIYYQSAKLQNAVDSATVSVAHNLMADDTAIKTTVEKYMKENGVDIANGKVGTITSGNLKTKISYGDADKPSSVVVIDRKGILTEAAKDADDGQYISSGYLKVTVKITRKGYLTALSGIGDRPLVKSGYAKCDIQYNKMPETLKYSIFANSPEIKDNYKEMALKINGRTNNAQEITNIFVNLINKINEDLIQKIIGWTGGEPNYNELVNASLSHAIINADVHSNSDISIGVNAIQASRSKDADYEGKEEKCICQSLCKRNYVNTYCDVCQSDYRKCIGDVQTEDDYNQVHFTAVNKIDFSAGKIANNSLVGVVIGSQQDINTRVFVRNYQYVEQTQVALNVINHLDFDRITSTESLRNAYRETAEEYMENSVTLPEVQYNAVINQADNLNYISKGKYEFVNQKSIVYAATNAMANQVMLEAQGGNTLTNFLAPVLSKGIDPVANETTLLQYDGTKVDKENSVITFTKTDSDQTAELYIADCENTNRNVVQMHKLNQTTEQAEAGYRFAIAKTFRQYSSYIEVPNFKPYFIRAVNRSIRNSTTLKADNEQNSDTSDATSIKDAVRKAQAGLEKTINLKNTLATVENKDDTFSKSAADATNDPSKVPEGEANTYVDNSFSTSGVLTSKETSPLFKFKLTSTDSSGNSMDVNSYTLAKYGSDDEHHTKFNGVNIYDKNGKLNTAKNVVDSYAKKNADKYGKDAVKKFEKEYVLVNDDYNNPSVHDYDKHYGSNAVAKKKHYIENTLTLSSESRFEDSAPKKDDVFLMSSGTKKSYFDKKIKEIEDATDSIDEAELTIPADLRTDRVPSRYKTLIEASLADLGYTLENSVGVETTNTANISKNYTKLDGTVVNEKYSYESLLPGQDNNVEKSVDSIVAETRNDFKLNAEQIGKKVNDKYNELRVLESTTGWTKKGTVGKYAADNFPHEDNRIVLEDKCYYEKIENAWSHGIAPWRYGILVKSGSKVQVDGAFSLDNSSGHATTIIGDKSYSDFDEDAQDELKQTYLYVKGNVEISRCDVFIGDNTTVIVDGHVYVDGHSLTIGKNSKLICGYEIRVGGGFTVGENSVVVSYQANTKDKYSVSMNTMVAEKGSEIYAVGDIRKVSGSDIVMNGKIYCQRAIFYGGGSGNMIFGEGSQTFLGRDLSTNSSGDITIGENAVVVVNRPTEWADNLDKGVVDVSGEYTLTMKTDSVLVTQGDKKHRIKATRYYCDSGSLIVTDMIKSNTGSKEYTSVFGNVICQKMDVRTTEFAENAHIFASEEIYVQDSKTLTFNPGVKLLLGKNSSGQSISNCGGLVFKRSPENKVFALGATGTISGFQKGNGNHILYNGSYLSVPGLNINDLTVEQGGGFCVPKDSSITVNNLTINDGTSTYIGTLNVNNLVVNSDVKIEQVGSANSITVNDNAKLLVEKSCTVKDVNVSPNGKLLATKTLTINGTAENFGEILVGLAPSGTNPGNEGNLEGSGTINNSNLFQVYGYVNCGELNNKYNINKSRGSTVYISKTANFNSVNNEKECKIIGSDKSSFYWKNLANSGKLQVGTLLVNDSFVNNAGAEIRVDVTASTYGVLENNGFLQVSGNAIFNIINNTANLKIGGNATFGGSVTNASTGKLQCTSFGATFNSNIDNDGEMSIAGSIVAKGLFENNNFVCSNNNLCYFNSLQNSGVVSIGGFKSGSNIINDATGLIEVYGGGCVSNINTLVNNGDFVSNVNIEDFGNILNYGKLECFGTLNSVSVGSNLNNCGKVYCHSNVTVNGTITNGTLDNHDAMFYASASTSAEIYATNIENYANFFAHDINVRVVESFSCYEGSKIYVDTGDITTNNFEINAKCSLKYGKNFAINSTLINRTNLKLTKISAQKIQNEGTLFVDSGNKDFLIDYIWNKKDAKFAFAGPGGLQFIGNDSKNVSLWNEGNMYVKGNISAKGAIRASAGELYVYGNADVSNSVSYFVDGVKNNVYMEGSAELYVYGDIPRSNNSDGMMIAESSDAEDEKAVYSIYGYQGLGAKNSHSSGLINCYQTGAHLYFGGDLKVKPPQYLGASNKQTVKGNMFVYGEYTCAYLMTFYIKDGGVVYIEGNVNCPLTTDLYLENFAGIYCFGKSVKFHEIYANKSFVYLLKITDGGNVVQPLFKVTLENASVLFTPMDARIPSHKLEKSDDSFYAPDPEAYISISSRNFVSDGVRIVTSGNILITEEITIKEGQMLCANNIKFANNGKLNVKGTLYVIGQILNDNGSTTSALSNIENRIDFTGPKADVFIGKTKSGKLEFNSQLDAFGEQTLFFDNDIIVNGNLANDKNSKGGISGSNLVPNRGESIIVEGNSNLYVTGNVFSNGENNNKGNAVYVGENCSLSCGGAFYSDSAIYNFGKFYVFGEFVNYKKADGTEESDARAWPTDYGTEENDPSNYLGRSILNGSSNNRNASIYIGGLNKNGEQSKNTIIFVGYVQNYGKINIMQDTYIKGHNSCSYLWMRTIGEDPIAAYCTNNDDYGAKASIVAEQGSRAHFGGNIAMLGAYVTFNTDTSGNKDEMPIFSSEGDATYGQAIFNGGIFHAKGTVGYTGEAGFTKDVNKLGEQDPFRNYYIKSIWIRYYASNTTGAGDWKGTYSIVNGFTFYPRRNGKYSAPIKNAVFYAGGNLKVGTSEKGAAENKIGGTVQNYGTMYVNGSLDAYTYEKYAINYIALSAQLDSNTFIAGNCFSNSGTVLMRNTLFMCDGNFISKRCTRICVSEKVDSKDDLNASSYLYVGGNMATSTNGTGGAGDIAGSYGGVATWNYLDIFSNANIYVGGSFFTNSIFTPHKNVTLIVDGLDKGGVNTSTNFITWLQKVVNGLSLKIDGYEYDNFKFIVNNRFDVQQTLREGRTKSMFNSFYVHGSVFLNGRARIADMTKFYVYGDFVNRTDVLGKITAFEVGRALNVSDDGDTWASKGTFVDTNDEPRFIRDGNNVVQNPNFDYNYANACYLYVQGKLDLDRKVNIYPGTKIRTGKDYTPRGMVKLMHDTSVYSGGKIATHRYIDVGQYSELFAKENINAWNYICVREHGTLYSGGDVKCGTSFEAKTKSIIYTLGSIKATLSNIKIRDNSTVFCSGNMTAFSYIELGKHDERYKDTLRDVTPKSGDNVCTCTGHCTNGDYDADCPVCGKASKPAEACKAPYECICSELCTNDNYSSDCPVCNGSNGTDYTKCRAEDPDKENPTACTCTSRCSEANPNCPVCKNDFSQCAISGDEATELNNDLLEDYTDSADGGVFYIGKVLASYTGYIRQYGFSDTVVGQYVFANRYVTLRSSSNMWVLPEAYNNDTYKHVDASFESDGTIAGDILKALKTFAYNLKEKLSFKNGSVYAMGNVTLNKNASLMGTYDLRTFGKTLLCHDSLTYFGHDVKCSTTSLDLGGGSTGNGWTGFKASGDVYTTLKCTNKAKHPNGYTIYTKNYDPSITYKCDKCGATLSHSTVKNNVTCPATVYANNEIYISTSTDMKMCYLVACNGDVTISDPFYNSSSHDENNVYQLPNAIASYNGNITYNAIYGKMTALFYAPLGKVTLDGFYQEIWGSIIGDTVDIKTFYINIHRFPNWRTMDLQIAESGSVYLISQEEYEKHKNNVDESYLHTGNTEDESKGGASIFFDPEILAGGSKSGTGLELDTTSIG